MNQAERHQAILDTMHDTFVRKNQDYGNSFHDLYQEFGLTSSIIRLQDKLSRLKTLSKQEAQVKDESIRDTLLDLANYAVMTILEMDRASVLPSAENVSGEASEGADAV